MIRGIRSLLVGAAVLAAGCPTANRPRSGGASKTVRVRAVSEAAAVRVVASVGSYLYSASSRGLVRWDASGTALALDLGHGAGDRVIALAADAGRSWLWTVTTAAVGYVDAGQQTFVEIPAPPRAIGLDLSTVRAVAAAADGGLWLGSAKGLLYTNPGGQWTPTKITEPVTSLYAAADGWLWIGTERGIIGKNPAGESFRYGADVSAVLATVRFVVRGPGGGVLAVGEDAAGKQAVAIGKNDKWSSYKVSPAVRWDAAVTIGDTVIAVGGGRLYRLAERDGAARRPLTRDGYRLLPSAGDAAAPFVEQLAPTVPAGGTAIASWGTELVLGTRDLGVARIANAGAGPLSWLRRGEMLDGATSLSVACHNQNDCWLATGARRAWHWRGDDFEADGPVDQSVLAVVGSPDGDIYAIHRPGDGKKLIVSRVAASGWSDIAMIETPGERPEVSVARFSPGGLLWVGLRYHQGKDERPFGVALVDVSLGAVAYHRASADQRELRKGILPVPIEVFDAAFMDEDEVWFATSEGAARLTGKKVMVWNESNGLASERVRAIAASPGGIVFAGTGVGVGEFDGDRWAFPRELAFPVNDVALGKDGKLWLATERGVAVFDGKRVKRLDVRRGLLENQIEDVALDPYGRVWARGATSITLISP
ncbi:MAG: hypothetical protein K8W52_32485 [Deltaproteobacteria bacterium]|nr:hypothetical protein [Deltaproteobacteria bacterium]